jgi:hypothetical protein
MRAPSVTANLQRDALKMPDTISTHSSRSARPRKRSKKIFELEARLKVAAEENSGLKKKNSEVERWEQ